MSFVRRSFAALAGVLLLQLTLLGSGTLCVMQHGTAPPLAGQPMHDMAGMRGATGLLPQTILSAGDMDSPAPVAPGHCASMAPCGMNAALTPAVTASPTPRVITLSVAFAAVAHSAPSLSPELPPPRA